VAHELEVRILQQLVHVVPVAGVEIVRGEHVVAHVKQALAQVGADETRPAGDESPFAIHEAAIYQLALQIVLRISSP
jgi:hypothetical protein